MKDTTNQQALPGAALKSMPASRFVTKQLFSDWMLWSVRTTDNLLRDRKIPCIKLGKLIRIPWPEARDHLLRNYRVNARGK